MAFSVKSQNTLNLPLPYLAFLYPYCTEYAFRALSKPWDEIIAPSRETGVVTVGQFEEKDITVSIGKFGPYVRHNNKFYSLGKNDDPYEVTLERSIEIIKTKREAEEQKEALKKIYPHEIGTKDGEAVMSNIGRFGPYLTYKGENFRLAKGVDPLKLTLADAMDIINNSGKKKSKKK